MPQMPVNVPPLGIRTGSLVTKADAQGAFTLRGARILYSGNVSLEPGSAEVVALAQTLEGNGLIGAADSFPFRQTIPAGRKTSVTIGPAITVRGKVVDAVTKKPVAGVRVRLKGDPSAVFGALMPQITLADGSFTFTNCVPATHNVEVLTSLDGYSEDSQEVFTDHPTSTIEANDITIRPLVKVNFAFTDLMTGKPLEVPLTVSWSNNGTGTSIVLPAGGQGSLSLPVGSCRLRVYSFGYNTSVYPNIPAETGKTMTFPIERSKGTLYKLVTTNPAGFKGCSIALRNQDGKEVLTDACAADGTTSFWFFSVDRHTGKGASEFIVKRDRQPATEPVKLSLEQSDWLKVIEVQ